MIGLRLFGAAFSATSMIGFIALAGIIVRNSILLANFIRHGRRPETSLRNMLLFGLASSTLLTVLVNSGDLHRVP